jgi:dTDP-4-dehydrorhamnose reductase
LKKKILILGGSSLISVNIAYFFKRSYDLYLACNSKKPLIENTKSFFTSFKKKNLISLLKKIHPSIVIISLANTNIEDCEKFKRKTKLINYEIVKIIVDLSKIYKFKIIFFSTDQVYSGNENNSNENNSLLPLNYYAKTKILSEKYIQKNIKNSLILRTNFFGYGPKYRNSFSDSILNSYEKKITKSYFVDNKFSSIYMPYLAKILNQLINKNCKGIFNLCSSDSLSKYDFAYYLLKKFKPKVKYIKKSYLKSNIALVNRPLNMSMSNKKLLKKINLKIPLIKNQILKMRKDHNGKYYLFMKKLKVSYK